MHEDISIAIETSCRAGGLALGIGDTLVKTASFDASARHTTQLIRQMRDLLAGAGLAPERLDHVYVSAGPGSFTGLRIGMTVARTMAQAMGRLNCVAVPTAEAIAQNACALPWEHLGVLLAAKLETVYAALFAREQSRAVTSRAGRLVEFDEFLAGAPRPLLLIGEGLDYVQPDGEGVSRAPRDMWLPTAEGTWRVGRRLATEGRFSEYHNLLPNYARRPEALKPQQQDAGKEG